MTGFIALSWFKVDQLYLCFNTKRPVLQQVVWKHGCGLEGQRSCLNQTAGFGFGFGGTLLRGERTHFDDVFVVRNIFLAIFLIFLLRFKMIVSFDFIKDIDLWSFIFSLFLFPYLDWIYQKEDYNPKLSRKLLILFLIGIFSPFVGSRIQIHFRNNAQRDRKSVV